LAAVVVAAALTGLTLPLLASSATAATVNPGTLKVSPGSVSAGSAGDAFIFGYTAPGKAASGTVSITVPAGFSAPQDTTPGGAGFLSVSSACAHFQVTGIAPVAGGTAVTVALNCAAKQAGTVVYQDVTAPTAAGGYPFATAFTPAGSQTPAPFAAQHQVTVKPGPLAEVVLSPATATIAPGGTQSYTAQGLDAFGNLRGDVTAATKFKISPNGSCTGASCTATATGPHTVSGTHDKITGTAALSVGAPAQADLSAVEAVSNATPFFDTSVTFTTTVTNNGPAAAAGVTMTVAPPSGLVSPTVTPGTGSYASGTWTIGSLAAGANATLTITGLAGDVSAGTQTVTATVTATTQDPNPANNTATASEASQPAPVGLKIIPDPGNPSLIDISAPGTVTWTGSAFNVANPAGPPPADGTYTWTCSTESEVVLCPEVPALTSPDSPSITFTDNTLGVDSYTLTVTFSWADPNYQPSGAVSTSVEFTTIYSG
jgi:uncharacterized repeat protein (TIGR01451 family)